MVRGTAHKAEVCSRPDLPLYQARLFIRKVNLNVGTAADTVDSITCHPLLGHTIFIKMGGIGICSSECYGSVESGPRTAIAYKMLLKPCLNIGSLSNIPTVIREFKHVDRC